MLYQKHESTKKNFFPIIHSGVIKNILSEPLLSIEKERALAYAWYNEKDEEALRQLITSHIRLVLSVCYRFSSYGIPLYDLMQEGTIGLLEAAKRFEPHRGVRFSSYAKWWVRSAVQSYVLSNWSIVKLGITSAQKSLFFSLNKLKSQLNNVNALSLREENKRTIATLLKVSLHDINEMEQRLVLCDYSLNNILSEENNTQLQDIFLDTHPTPEEQFLQKENKEKLSSILQKACEKLSHQELFIIKKRRLGDIPESFETIGKELGIKKEKVKEVEKKALRKMKFYFLSNSVKELKNFK